MSKSQAQNTKYSLLNPDFSDLWSVSWLGGKYNEKQETNLLNDVVSLVTMFLFPLPAFVGSLSPIIICVLCIYKFYTLSICITAALLYPYIFPVKSWPAFCRFVLKYGSNYFEGGCSMIFEAAPDDPSSSIPAMYGYHPHGILCLGVFYNSISRVNFIRDQPKEITQIYCDGFREDKCSEVNDHKIVVHPNLYRIPIFRHIWVNWTKSFEKSDKNNVKCIMENKQTYGLLPGGFYEVGLFENGKEFVYISKKKGFIKYALQYGYKIVPVYTFGESLTYSNLLTPLLNKYAFVRAIRQWLCEKELPSCIFYGHWYCPILPYRNGVGLHTIHGAAIEVPQIEKPTQEDIDKYHDIYCTQIKSLFDRNKHRFGMDDIELIVY